LVVGTVLNLINQGDVILMGQWDGIHWGKLLLTYLVPFCVSVYSALQVRLAVE
ncbi:MAG: nitrate/nitrite transporter NrtS, partial [Pseudomonadota bacterium]